ncbi:bifunctional 3'-5' exonuclease/DNA polymerase [Saxibacter everestensis]|uniref:DNA-directed DNA polymerase n=1 Tax=Saxibacter everestensis TaxID=2909229 RepID=A0ABY8QPY6_9MICO|nr:bifunctional 3'-5' exonuclease/DNA polymerase [Brevibacteriaceae bacterium ZFBP1038]
MYLVLGRHPQADGRLQLFDVDDSLTVLASTELDPAELPAVTALRAPAAARWVWANTAEWYPMLLRAGIRIDRCIDLRLTHAILRRSELSARSKLATADDGRWDMPVVVEEADQKLSLFDADRSADELTSDDVLQELRLQHEAIEESLDPRRLKLLLAAESAGALIAVEMKHDGLPFNADVHHKQLTLALGPRPQFGGRPEKLEHLARQIRALLDAPRLNPDSAIELLRALKRAGLDVSTTRQWELERLEHPVTTPLLEYKKLSRLLTANGWAWMDAWIRDGRFHPDYVPGGVVTGRWATRGGGALQLPKQIRSAVVADQGWKLVVADAAQLEPRVLSAMSHDAAMASASLGKDLYQGLVDNGVVDTRAHAKLAMLGALYGSTTGESAQLMPRLQRAYPAAIGMVETAAQTGERGGIVSTWLGRSSPPPGSGWNQVQQKASDPDAGPADERRARSQARERGRFTRNFIVQGSAAEWALCWMANLRQRLASLPTADLAAPWNSGRPHLVFFMHDEVMVHTPEDLAEDVHTAVLAAARDAGRLMFGTFPIDFALQVAVVDNYAQAK